MHQLQARAASFIQKLGEVNNHVLSKKLRISRHSFHQHPRRAWAALLPLRWELHKLGQLQPVECSLPDPQGMRIVACGCLFWQERNTHQAGEGIKQARSHKFSAHPSQPALSHWLLVWASPCPSPSPAAQELVLGKPNSTSGTGQ